MANDRAFLESIIEMPDDDASRLIYADWLEERGGDIDKRRAGFIRNDCALAVAKIYSPEWRQILRKRNEALYGEKTTETGYRKTFPFEQIKELLGLDFKVRSSKTEVEIERGFINGIKMMGTSIADMEKIFKNAPARHLYLGDQRSREIREDWFRDLFSRDFFKRVEKVSFNPNELNSYRIIGILANSPQTACLKHLSDIWDGGSSIRSLSGSEYIRPTSLEIFGMESDREIVTLATSSAMADLRNLRIGFRGNGDAGLQALEDSAHISNLNELSIQIPENSSSQRLVSYIQSDNLGRLKKLRIICPENHDFGNNVVQAICSLPELQELDLASTGINADSISIISSSEAANRLVSLKLPSEVRLNEIGNFERMSKLEVLSLCCGGDNMDNALTLADRGLESLRIVECLIGGFNKNCLIALAASEKLPRLDTVGERSMERNIDISLYRETYSQEIEQYKREKLEKKSR